MAYYIEPDKIEEYKKKGEEYNIVLNYYNDSLNLVNWHREYLLDQSVGEAGTENPKKLKEWLKSNGWKKIK